MFSIRMYTFTCHLYIHICGWIQTRTCCVHSKRRSASHTVTAPPSTPPPPHTWIQFNFHYITDTPHSRSHTHTQKSSNFLMRRDAFVRGAHILRDATYILFATTRGTCVGGSRRASHACTCVVVAVVAVAVDVIAVCFFLMRHDAQSRCFSVVVDTRWNRRPSRARTMPIYRRLSFLF